MRTRVPLIALVFTGMVAVIPGPTPAQPPGQPPVRQPSELAAVPTDSFMFVTVKVSKLWDTPGFKPIRDWFTAQTTGPFEPLIGVSPAEIDRATLFAPSVSALDGGGPLLLVTTKKPYNEAKVLKNIGVEQQGRGLRRTGNAIHTDHDVFPFVVFVDERTLLFLPKTRDSGTGLAEYLGQLLAKKTDGALAAALTDADKHDLAFALDARSIVSLFEGEGLRELAPYVALLKTRTITFAADFDKTARGYLKLSFPNTDDAKRAAPVLKEGLDEITGAMSKELERRKDRMDPAERIFIESAITVLKAAKVEANGANVFATAEVPYQDAVTKFAAALPKSYPAAVSSIKGQNNLKQLAIGMHNFHDTMGYFPSDVFGGGPNPPAWSWRVQILPYLEQDNLYRQLDLSKPWDAAENLKKLETMEMPKLFEILGRPAPKGHTYFRIFTMPKNAKGKDRPFLIEGQKGPTIATISDGTSNTFMIVEAGESVPWYKPDVLAYDGQLPLPTLGDKSADRFIVAFCDGSVRVLRPSKLGEKTLRSLITPNGGEVVDLP